MCKLKPSRNAVLFMLLCVIWGTTWIGIKAGVEAVPPLFFAGTRFLTAGAILLAFVASHQGWPTLRSSDWPRLICASLFMIALCYGSLFWGMLYVDSGTAAVLELSLTPIALMGFALLLREEQFDQWRLFALILGVTGLIILFGPTAVESWSGVDAQTASMRLLGAIAVCFAAVIYGWGSVIARPLLRSYPAIFVSGLATSIGGAVLLACSVLVEPGANVAIRGQWGWAAWSGWLFLVIFGSLIGYTIYMRLLRDIGATRAGTYAFVSPVIAVLLGAVTFGEEVSQTDLLGMAVMLAAAWLAMRQPSSSE